METYLFTIWLLWPKVAGQQPSEIIRHTVDSVQACYALVNTYAETVAADGVIMFIYNCIEQWGV